MSHDPNSDHASSSTSIRTSKSALDSDSLRSTSDLSDTPVIKADDIEKRVIGSVGIDSGGSFNKLVFFKPEKAPDLPSWVTKEDKLPNSVPGLHPDPNLVLSSGMLRFIKFPRHQTSAFIDFVQKTSLHKLFSFDHLNVTGGGAFAYAEEISRKLNISVNKLDEMETLISGLNFLLEHDKSAEVFTIDPVTKEQQFGVLDHLPPDAHFPYLLVNIGSGVSILKITGPCSYERVSGSSIGGGTFWGLTRLLANLPSTYSATAWDEAQELSNQGKSENVDLLVGDIYGEEDEKYARLGLHKSIIASSFGRVATTEFEDGKEVRAHYRSEDIVRSLLFMIANNIGQIAYLVAELHKIERVFFSGGFIEHNTFLWSKFAYAIMFWSKERMKALFLRHNGYLGALGAIIKTKKESESDSNDSNQ